MENNTETERMEQTPEVTKTTRKEQKRKSIWFSSLTSGIVGSLLTCSVFVFGADYIDFNQTSQNDTQGAALIEEKSDSAASLPVAKTSYSNDNSGIADMVEKASNSIVGVINYQQQQSSYNGGMFPKSSSTNSSSEVESGTGSGVMYKKEGNKAYIITNNHVIENASKVEVSLSDGVKTAAEIVGSDALTDLAVLTIDASKAPDKISFGNSDAIRTGDSVIAIGNPLGLDLSRTVTQGIVSATGRSIDVTTSAGEWNLDVIQTDAAINPGNSGGALINAQGDVIGINSLKISEDGVEGLGFAIPSNDLLPIVEEIIKDGKVTRPYLGVSLGNVGELPQNYQQSINQAAAEGVMITSVENGSPAAEGGLLQQDIITEINGTKITTTSELRKYLYKNGKVGQEMSFTVYRGDDNKTLKIKLGKS